MPPKIASASCVYIVIDSDAIDSVHASSESANRRVAAAKKEGHTSAKVAKHTLVGGSIQVKEDISKAAPQPKKEPKSKAEPKSKPTMSNDNESAPKANTAAKKTKPPAEQLAANQAKPGKLAGADVSADAKVLLDASGTALQDLRVVVTGVPPTLGRKNAEKLVEQYGGTLTKSLSKNTNLVVVGNDAGPKKLEQISDLALKTVDENGLLEMLRKGGAADGGAVDGEEEEDEGETRPKKRARKQK